MNDEHMGNFCAIFSIFPVNLSVLNYEVNFFKGSEIVG